MKFYTVITTIQAPTPAVVKTARAVAKCDGSVLIVGDRKGPFDYPLKGTELLDIEQQRKLPFRLARLLPENHYVRKNLGYLTAFERKAECIYETDDDNEPLGRWSYRTREVNARHIAAAGWFNAYSYFAKDAQPIWPRGYPLDKVAGSVKAHRQLAGRAMLVDAPIQQGLANGSPDVDAVWRLILDRPYQFARRPSLYLAPGTWCPFNSQSTWWWPEAYPLMYLPSYCTFRMTDIWRSFVAQQCLWAMGKGVVFHEPEVFQGRNYHNLMRDFKDEVPGYLENSNIVERLTQLKLKRGVRAVPENLLACYESLVALGVFPKPELTLVKAWLHDLKRLAD